ncbi:MAG: hypothetical protein JWR10_442 [Rubritepida sp.]|nr:hypothetical protein [Rubritepida sp.]
MNRWRITIQAWPYSTGSGAATDQKAAGEREQNFYVDASDIRLAMKMAECIASGIEANPAVWQAPIVGVQVERDVVVRADPS